MRSSDQLYAEPECCDGSDEPPGVCPNKCAEIGEEYRKKVEQEMKTRKTVSACIESVHIITLMSRPQGVQNTFDIHSIRAEGEETARGAGNELERGNRHS